DLLVLGPDAHMRWLLGFAPHKDERACLLFIGQNAEAFLTPALNAEDIAARTDLTLYRWSDADGPKKALGEALAAVGSDAVKSVAVDETARADHVLLALDAIPGVAHGFAQSVVGELRVTKN